MVGYLPNYRIGIYNESPELEEPFHTVEEAIDYYRNELPDHTEACGNDLWIGVEKVDIDDGYVRVIEVIRKPQYRFYIGDDGIYAKPIA